MIQKGIVWHQGNVTRQEREGLLQQAGVTIWLTGLSASGKSTLAFALERRLLSAGRACFTLDGDNVRHGLNRNLGFSIQDRSENIRRVAEVARLMNEAGLIVVVALISPLRADRLMAKEVIGAECFKEVYVSTPLEACEARDPKGLYGKARAGELAEFTGISSPYESPPMPDLIINTLEAHIDDAVEQLYGLIKSS
ncbi:MULTISPECIES: adenylyl-sulfate kinase [unclassified Pseudomonas]|uniref:adenylyl-sulfate kinase n=1 Tax=unclassified Pseudomonas TaxID=196821 RepID=UPI000EA8D162|nr:MULTISPECIES: adenylyl-sulfate kinase [unclassified Pseudomonas]AYF89604.1 adenylyl-sulfate kinase [Pseudomonas sp. DY-1]MDH4656151.1 adenylyl-sulfate kinase [Pseudomonas sp. BN606]MRK21240.1 adenylyl-sulfate kinase [Pseudomonas sp. JG-B]